MDCRLQDKYRVRRIIAWIVLATATCTAADAPLRADHVLVLKSQRVLILMKGTREIKRYKVSLGTAPVGPKTRQGDHHTPEGEYVIDRRNAHSSFYRALHVSYPNKADRESARRAGVEPGGGIMIHGLPNGFGSLGHLHLKRDWTDGCIAVTDEEMDEIWQLVPDGTPIEIRP